MADEEKKKKDKNKEFNVTTDYPRFETFVNNLRSGLADPARTEPLFVGVYVLRPFTDVRVANGWLQLTMAADVDAIVLMIRLDNLYLVGFRQDRTGGRTWEFGRMDPRTGLWQGLLAGSDPLGFNGGYNNNGIGDLQMNTEEQPELGRHRLEESIRGLARYEGPRQPPPEVRLWLRTVIVNVIEPIRSPTVCTFIHRQMQQPSRQDESQTAEEKRKLIEKLINIIRNWQKISECVIRSANDPANPELYRHLRHICSNAFEARQAVAIVYRGHLDPPARRNKRSAAAVDGVPPGLTFVEVFAVVVRDMDCASRGDMFGTIAVDDGLGPEVLFRRDRAEAQPVGPGELAELVGPKRAIWGYDEVVFDLGLSHASRVLDMSPDEEISKGQMVWNTNMMPVEDYDKAQEHVVRGLSGAVKICYAAITDAVVATVVVELTNNGGSTALYGSITAATSGFPDKKIKLFNTDWKNAATMIAGHGQCIQLLRNVLVVQLGSSLTIDADVWVRAFLPDMSPPEYQVSKGEAKFDAALAGTASKDITGTHGEATVRVTWTRT